MSSNRRRFRSHDGVEENVLVSSENASAGGKRSYGANPTDVAFGLANNHAQPRLESEDNLRNRNLERRRLHALHRERCANSESNKPQSYSPEY